MISTATVSHLQGDIYAKARFNMVESQIRTNRVTDERLLEELLEIPRHLFVPAPLASVAYVDKALKIAPDRYLMEPLFVARLLQEVLPTPSDTALVVGAGTGYATAILANLVKSVVAVECDAGLADKARANLAALEIANVTVETGPLELGCSKAGPYDIILIDGMVDHVRDGIFAQLAEHGRLVTIVALEGRCGVGTLYCKLGGAVSGRALFDANAPLLPGFARQPAFEF